MLRKFFAFIFLPRREHIDSQQARQRLSQCLQEGNCRLRAQEIRLKRMGLPANDGPSITRDLVNG